MNNIVCKNGNCSNQNTVSLELLFRELDKCDKAPGNGVQRNWCKDQVRQQWIQNIIGPRIYPWANFRWDYQQYVINNYEPMKLGLDKKDTSTTGLIKNIGIIIKLIRGLINDPNPSNNSRAGIDDQPSTDNPIYPQYIELKRQIIELLKNPNQNAGRINALRDTLEYMERSNQITAKDYGLGKNYEGSLESPPYDDKFFNKPLKGQAASSYFIQSGFCKTNDKNQKQCKDKGHNWIGDQCYKGKYLYLDNSSGLKVGYVKDLGGLIPSLINEATQLSPNNYIGLLQGYDVPGVEIQNCDDEIIEKFINKEDNTIGYNIIPWIILIGIIMYIFYMPKL